MTVLDVTTTAGNPVAISEQEVADLRGALHGLLILPSDAGYDDSRRVWNGMTDKRPAMIAQCLGASDVMSSVRFAKANNLLVAVRGGGHSIAGHSVCQGGLMIDLARMNDVRVDRVRHTARAGGGAKWRDFDHETQAFGLATTGGTNTDTGIAGLTLGGGLGWLAGKYGLTCDNLLSADVVTADGQMLVASAEENPDLFWGLRGGSGNFGVVTSFEYRLHEVGPVLAGLLIYPFDRAKDVLRFYGKFSREIPDELNTIAVLLTLPDGQKAAVIGACYNGDLAEGEKVLQPLRDVGPPMVVQLGPMPYVAVQSMLDASFPPGRQYYWKAHLMGEISDSAIDAMIDHFSRSPSPFTALGFQQLGNAANRVGPEETAFSHRDALYDFLMLSGWEDPSDAAANVEWTRDVYAAMQPSLHAGIYVNGLGEDSVQQTTAAFRPGTYERLLALKNKFDPTNFFRLNPNIKPTG
jgi:FAD binding domain/Berberine and berberine like